MLRHRLPLRLVLALPFVFAPMAISAATSTAPGALDAFAARWSSIGAYSATLAMHEIAGNDIQDRTYAFTYKRPSDATIVITKGPGRGGKVTWTGGDRVTGSPPGLFSGVKIHLPITDSRVTSLRGDTVAMASFGWVLDHFRRTAGVRSEAPGATVDGTATTTVSLAVADPANDDGLTKEVLVISDATRLPLSVRRYAGMQLVKEIQYLDVTVDGVAAQAAATGASDTH